MKEKQFTIEFTDSELELLYDALTELGYSVEDETEAKSISSLLNRIAEAVKVA